MDGVHGDENNIDVEPYMKDALADVVICIMLFGQYPSTREVWNGERIRFMLREFMIEECEDEIIDLAMCAAMYFVPQTQTRRNKILDIVEAKLSEHLRDSDIVREVAERMFYDAKDEA